MTSADTLLERITAAARTADRPPSLHLRPSAQSSDFGRRLAESARRVVQATSGAISLTVADPAEEGGFDQLTMRVGGRDVIHYRAVPEGPEEDPFLEALLALVEANGTPGASDQARSMRVVVFIAPDCPNCPQAVRAVASLAIANPHFTATIVDATEFDEWAQSVGVRSVPLTVVDDALTLVGVISEDELADRLMMAKGPDGERTVFESLVDAGRFSAAARRLLEGKAREAFANRWRSSTLESRIGLVLTAEEALALDSRALDALVPELLTVLEPPDSSLRGDTADLVGRIGDPRAIPALESLCNDPVEDVAEVAEEALEEIRSKK
jgi:CBS domain-containing protein